MRERENISEAVEPAFQRNAIGDEDPSQRLVTVRSR
jgi:hypothetical protein